ncbi:PaREP1 family protein [Pyrolobus fumarii 1A]|uniref:PaREP1 family protein n=1 Tax=Pyrolobus fumarii (strain DSM 11204 / 1A) TaxID=694429 RepID=G0ECZ4_PYRF1|nr:PaREP1 family protein [Pyrolobus fumarii]AEM39714.1 PaREP1 family protein [Pyrolobus fumarii 1A]
MARSGLLEEPLPKPRRDPAGYASARILEVLLEALLALRFLGEGYTRNAAGKVFQAWRALTAAILALELDRVLGRFESERDRKWILEKGLPRVPSTRLKTLGQLIEELGYPHYTHFTSTALDLHDYQYHGPDPDAELSKYANREEAARDIIYLLERLTEIIEERVKPRLEELGKWDEDHEKALKELKGKLGS